MPYTTGAKKFIASDKNRIDSEYLDPFIYCMGSEGLPVIEREFLKIHGIHVA